MLLYFETSQTVIQSTPMSDFSLGFPEGRFLPLNGQKHLRSVVEDEGADIIKTLKPIFRNRP